MKIYGFVLVAYLVLFGAANLLWLRRGGWDGTASAGICFLPALLCLVFTFTSEEDVSQYLARVLACMMFTPILLLFWSTDVAVARPVWPFAVAASVIHTLAFVGAIWWSGTTATRLPAEAGVSPVSAGVLRARLLSLNEATVPIEVTKDEAGEVTAWFRFREGEGRSHAVILGLDEAKRQVRVKERLTQNAARPKDAQEASMRSIGDPYFKPGRPDSARVFGKTAQTSLVKKDRLPGARLTMFDHRAEVRAEYGQSLDQDGMLALLSAVATRSGWTWQPAFFGD